ncbi:MAG: hypothetical protein HF978_03755 [Desulfobacteraceae bacterium]|nr:hypothetical protein [Desulfobacteraceae bacterium]MBC2754642.1 hypothetical protein [Desulfobacteraceae bacterium]
MKYEKYVCALGASHLRHPVNAYSSLVDSTSAQLYPRERLLGNYNPDWALIKTNEATIYFVAETKFENQELKISEKRKIKCGKAHFDEFDGVEYRQVSKVSDLD